MADGKAKGLRVLVLGMSSTVVCGVRDHATLLTDELREQGADCEMLWLDRHAQGLVAERAEVSAWVGEVGSRLRASPPDAVILHYSVFAFAYRGVPLFAHPLLAELARTRAPVLSIIHEAAYPWDFGGARGKLWALTQRLALIELMRRSSGVLVTAQFRAEWLTRSVWLARRPVLVAPVFSNLPAPSVGARPTTPTGRVGVFGYSYERAATAMVIEAVSRLRSSGHPQLRLLLLGAPGPGSAAAAAWQQTARAGGVEDLLSFTGTLSAQGLSDALAACDALLFVNAGGPSSRKGTLAGSLASGSPVVALDGPRGWSELRDGEQLRLAGQSVEELAEVLAQVLDDREAANALGSRAMRFASEQMGVARTARTLLELLDLDAVRDSSY